MQVENIALVADDIKQQMCETLHMVLMQTPSGNGGDLSQ